MALPFEKRDLKAELSKRFNVTGIPSLVLLDAATCELITNKGRQVISSDPQGYGFPWKHVPKDFVAKAEMAGARESDSFWKLVLEPMLARQSSDRSALSSANKLLARQPEALPHNQVYMATLRKRFEKTPFAHLLELIIDVRLQRAADLKPAQITDKEKEVTDGNCAILLTKQRVLSQKRLHPKAVYLSPATGLEHLDISGLWG